MRILLRWIVAAASLWVTLWLLHAFYPAGLKLVASTTSVLLLHHDAGPGVRERLHPAAGEAADPAAELPDLRALLLRDQRGPLLGRGGVTGAYRVDFVAALIGSVLMAVINGLASNLIVDRE